MTQRIENIKRISEFNTLFLSLNDKGRKSAFTILKLLRFAQSTRYIQGINHSRKTPKQKL